MAGPIIDFLPYQRRWLADPALFKIGMFSRQSGKTFSACGEIVDDAVRAEIARTRTRWVILSRGERQAKEAIDANIKPMVQAYYEIYRAERRRLAPPIYGEDVFHGGDAASYRTQEVEFPNGSRITALPANPDTARGFSANVLLDEFAFHKDSHAIWKALFPVVSKRGLRLRVVSTPNGKGNKFYELMTSRDLDGVWSRHTVDIYQAVREGLDRDIDALRKGMNDPDGWAQEYELQWLDEAANWLSYELIGSCEDERAGDPAGYQGGDVVVGGDIAARGDLFVLWVDERVGDVWWNREIITRRRASWAEMDALLDDVFARYRVLRACIDQTGMGEKYVADAQRRHGRYRVEGVLFTLATKQALAILGKQAFEDRTIRIPLGDTDLRADLHKLRKETSATGAPRFVAEADGAGHADRAWACFLARNAASNPGAPIDFQSTGHTRAGLDAFAGAGADAALHDVGWGTIGGGNDFRGW